ncbi:MAG: diguanylate cyclase [Alphaproteobacteria bacterium]
MAEPAAILDDEAHDAARDDAGALVAAHPGPALVLDSFGSPCLANDQAASFSRALVAGGLVALRDRVVAVAGGGDGARLEVEFNGRAYEVLLLPWGRPARVVALCRDVGRDRDLRRALIESRQRYKDFASCASDVLWETGPDGCFAFVSPAGALGFAAAELVGRDPAQLLNPNARRPIQDPFRTDVPVIDQELHLIGAGGVRACVVASSLPVFGDGGVVVGARGVWRDVTAERAREAELLALRRRDHAVAHIVGAMREEPDVGAMLGQGAAALVDTLGAVFASIYALQPGGLEPAASAGGEPAWLRPLVTSHLDADATDRMRDLVGEGLAILMVACRSRGRLNGALCLGCAESTPWSADERAIVEAVADAVELTIDQVRDHEAIRRLSRVDGLTGLLNRRAFAEETGRRGALAARRGTAASLFYIDLDHFKQVNDGTGHAAGDAALVAVAQLIVAQFRRGDVVARLGGDEFAIWCDDTGETDARAKAAQLSRAAESLRRLSPPDQPPLGLSIGVATRAGDGVADTEAMLAEADTALYAAKNAGRGTFAHAADLADPSRSLGDPEPC